MRAVIYFHTILKTSYTLKEIQTRLNELMNGKYINIGIVTLEVIVSKNHFIIRARKKLSAIYRNSFWPVLKGQVIETDTGTIINVDLHLETIVKVILIILIFMAVLFETVLIILHMFMYPISKSLFLIPIGIAALNLLVTFICVEIWGAIAIRLLKKVFEAE